MTKYVLEVPYKGWELFEVDANSKKEAIEKAKNCDEGCITVCHSESQDY